MRAIVFMISWLACHAAFAAVTCEQLGNIAFTTEQLRNQGYALETVLAEANKLESSEKFGRQDIGRVREVVEKTFSRYRTPLEIVQECRDALPR